MLNPENAQSPSVKNGASLSPSYMMEWWEVRSDADLGVPETTAAVR